MMINQEMSLRQLAKVIGVSQPFLSQIRAGKRPMPDKLKMQVEALGAYHLLITPVCQVAYSDTNNARRSGLGPGGRQFESARPDQI